MIEIKNIRITNEEKCFETTDSVTVTKILKKKENMVPIIFGTEVWKMI